MNQLETNKTQTQITEQLMELARNRLPPEKAQTITSDSVLVGWDPIFDSMSLLEFILEAETRFNVQLINDDLGLNALTTIRALSMHILQLKG